MSRREHYTNTYVQYANYMRTIKSGTKPNFTKLTLACTIAAVVLRMWKNDERYQPTYTTEFCVSHQKAQNVAWWLTTQSLHADDV